MVADSGRGLIDTSIVILRHRIPADDLPAEVSISAVTLAELSAGPHLVRGDGADARIERSRRAMVLQRAESEFDPIAFDAPCARVYGQLAAAVATVGRTPRRRHADLQIAATAAAHGLPLYTTNPTDYTGLDGLLEVVAVRRPT